MTSAEVIPIESTDALLQRMESRDKRFHRAIIVFLLFISLASGGIAAGVYLQSINRSTELQRVIDNERSENAKQTSYIQCIAQFFNTTDRQSRVLTNIDKCNIQKNGETVPGVDLTPTNPSSTFQTNPSPTGTLQGSSPQAATATAAPTPVDNSNNGSSLQPATPGPLQVTTPLPGPLNSIPLCVEVLGLCVR